MKKAIVVGNNQYVNIAKLSNAVHDAQDIANILSKLGFDVEYHEDINFDSFLKIMQDQKKLENVDEIFFYFSGHAIQYLDRNYLLPIDISKDLKANDILENEAIYLGDIVNLLQTINGTKIIVLDSCRNHNIQNELIKNDDLFNKGLVEIEATDNLLIAYATRSGISAFDKHPDSNNGLYTGVLKKYLKQYRLPINDVFSKTRNEIIEISDYKQIPWESSSLRSSYKLSTLDLSQQIYQIPLNSNYINTISTSSQNLIVCTDKSITFIALQEDTLDIYDSDNNIIESRGTAQPIVRNFSLKNSDYIEKCRSDINGNFYAASNQGNIYKIESAKILKCQENIGTSLPTIQYDPEVLFKNKNGGSFFAIDINEDLIVCADSENIVYFIDKKTNKYLKEIDLTSECNGIYELEIINDEIYLATSLGTKVINIETLETKSLIDTHIDTIYFQKESSQLFIATSEPKMITYNIQSREFKEVNIKNILNCRILTINSFKERFIVLGTDKSSIILYDLYLDEQVDKFISSDQLEFYSIAILNDEVLIARKDSHNIGFWNISQ